ncbi:MAG: signal peptide peptidase SppA [Daejeonella sp.]|uniref:signal peptide peptidase SppA n=1 Tax=Daejeonella sp. TaxID=2805397 RepID=UPI0027324640|nr:signal peptide peptidase SppA [Daejeonella sp.]MDP3468385.1 signal peptide peptidase SppA [Daejeonella sp.]
MKEFFKFVFASMIGFILSFFFVFILLIALIVGMISSAGGDGKVSPTSNSIMHVSLDYPIKERTDKNPFSEFSLMGFDNKKRIGLNEILLGLKEAKEDNHIEGIYLDVSSLSAGFATIEEIRNALIDFKKSGKFILAYSEVYTQGAYYLASVADKVYLNPEGMIDFRGLSSELLFFKGSLEKLEIEAQIIKVGTYKSAVEPFILDKMSEPNRQQVTSFLGSMYDHFLTEISKSRKIPKSTLFSLADSAKVRNPKDALVYKMIDGLKYKDEVLEELKTRTGTAKKKDLKSVSIEEYAPAPNEKKAPSSDRIALIYANGDIISGEGNDESIGSDRISRAIRKARMDDKVKAIVLRVNSPGGSALASDVIWREMVLTKKTKPVIVSMGDVAASGGYYIACAADSIFAQPNTITGSIGVFGIIPNMQNFFKNKLGITFDGVKTGKFADLGTVSRPMTDAEKMIIQQEVNKVYSTFTQKVADGRKKSQAYIDSIGQGRVWSGTEALQNGLVDRLGNIDDAIASAARKANLKDFKLVSYPDQVDPLKSLFENTGDKIKTYFMKQELGDQYIYYEQMKAAIKLSGVQARIPYNIQVK